MIRIRIDIDTVFLMATGWAVDVRHDTGELVELCYSPLQRIDTPEHALDEALARATDYLAAHGWLTDLPLA